MEKKINCFILSGNKNDTQSTVNQLNDLDLINKIFVLSPEKTEIENAEILLCNSPFSTETVKLIAEKSNTLYSLISLQNNGLGVGQFAPERMVQVAENTGATMVYTDYFEIKNGIQSSNPVIDYQWGSLRDDFNFGPVQLFKSDVLKSFDEKDYLQAGYYALRLHASRLGELVRIPEFLFTMVETDTRKSGEKQFDYVSGNAREKQIEMEKVCTTHLQKIGGLLQPPFSEVDFSETDFPVEASVIIPVRNRIKTIKDAVESVLSQKTSFSFNLIVIDNFSTDGTTELLAEYAKSKKLIHVIPDRDDLGIGGCWNVGIFNEQCGKFAVQLDSDDLYSSENTLQKIVDKFYEEKCAMVIGSRHHDPGVIPVHLNGEAETTKAVDHHLGVFTLKRPGEGYLVTSQGRQDHRPVCDALAARNLDLEVRGCIERDDGIRGGVGMSVHGKKSRGKRSSRGSSNA